MTPQHSVSQYSANKVCALNRVVSYIRTVKSTGYLYRISAATLISKYSPPQALIDDRSSFGLVPDD